jgi:hypothetical protein
VLWIPRDNSCDRGVRCGGPGGVSALNQKCAGHSGDAYPPFNSAFCILVSIKCSMAFPGYPYFHAIRSRDNPVRTTDYLGGIGLMN